LQPEGPSASTSSVGIELIMLWIFFSCHGSEMQNLALTVCPDHLLLLCQEIFCSKKGNVNL